MLFKAEVGAATPHACQLQGVWVAPDRRGRGHRRSRHGGGRRSRRCATIAPVVTLYVNDHNTAARAAYERVGFSETATFASVLL